MIADVAMHRPGKEGDQRNFHAHIMVTTRRVDRAGFGGKNRDWNHASFIPQLRAAWSDVQNRQLRHHLGPDAPQVSHLSLAARGVDRAPTVHLGPAATALERKDIAYERGELNRDVRARNDKARDLRRDYQATADRIANTAPEPNARRFHAEDPERRTARTRANGGGRHRQGAGEGSPSADRGACEEDPFAAPGTGGLGPQFGADDLGETRRAERHRTRPQGLSPGRGWPASPPGLGPFAQGPGVRRGAPAAGPGSRRRRGSATAHVGAEDQADGQPDRAGRPHDQRLAVGARTWPAGASCSQPVARRDPLLSGYRPLR